MDSYELLAEYIEDNPSIPREVVLRHLADHTADVEDFDDENGVEDFYNTQAVFSWLGY